MKTNHVPAKVYIKIQLVLLCYGGHLVSACILCWGGEGLAGLDIDLQAFHGEWAPF